jgi:hypothetical protein
VCCNDLASSCSVYHCTVTLQHVQCTAGLEMPASCKVQRRALHSVLLQCVQHVGVLISNSKRIVQTG